MHWTSFCGDAVKVVYLVHDPTWRAATLFWITELVDRVPAVPGYPEFPMAKFVKTPSLHACSWLGIFSKSSPFSGSFEIHSKWCNLQIHPSPDPSRKTCAVPGISCLEHGIGGNSAGANSSQGDLTTPLSPENHFRIQTRTALFRITPLIQDSWVLVGIVLVFTHIYPPFEISVCLWLTLWKLHCQFLGGGVTARTLVVERTLQQ